MVKRILSLGLLLIMVFSVAACGNNTDWQSRLDDLNEKIDRQTERIAELESGNAKQAEKAAELEEKIADLEDTNAKQAEKIADLEEANKIQKDMIDELENELESLIGPGIQVISIFVDDPAPSIYCAVKTIKTTFEIDKVKIRFYYGQKSNIYPDGAYSVAKIFVRSGSGPTFNRNEFDNKTLIKEIDDFHTEKYECVPARSLTSFNFSELFTIPKEIFVGEKGWINFYVDENTFDKDGIFCGVRGGGGYIYFYYKVEGETVTLSTTWFEN